VPVFTTVLDEALGLTHAGLAAGACRRGLPRTPSARSSHERVEVLVDRGHKLRARRRRIDGRGLEIAFARPACRSDRRRNYSDVFPQVGSGAVAVAARSCVGVTITRDPLDGVNGTPDLSNPYSYVHNSPVNGTDPTGMRCTDGICFVPQTNACNSNPDYRGPWCWNSMEEFCKVYGEVPGSEALCPDPPPLPEPVSVPTTVQQSRGQKLTAAAERVREKQKSLGDPPWSSVQVRELIPECYGDRYPEWQSPGGNKCPWGAFIPAPRRQIFVDPGVVDGTHAATASSQDTLYDVVAHEIAHAMMRDKLTNFALDEPYADCLAQRWGAKFLNYKSRGCTTVEIDAARANLP